MISTQYIKLNMTPNGIPPVLYCSQYDVGRPLGLVVYNGSDTVDLSTYIATIEATRTDRTPITAAVTTGGNVGVFHTTATMTNKLDRYGAKLVLSDSNGNRVASLVFFMVITPSTMDENAEPIQEDRSLYQQYTAAVQVLIEEIREDIADLNSQHHNTVADMKADTNLKTGMLCQTAGYYAVNDGGAALYRIYNAVPATHYETLANGLYAVLIADAVVSPEMFGAYGDGEHDDTAAWQAAVNCGLCVKARGKAYKCGTVSITKDIEINCNHATFYTTADILFNFTGKVVTTLTGEADYSANKGYTIANAEYSDYTGMAMLRGTNNFEKSRDYYTGGFVCTFFKGELTSAYPIDVTGVSVDIIDPIKYVLSGVDDIIHSAPGQDTTSIQATYAFGSIVKDSVIADNGGYSVICFDKCIECHVDNVTIRQQFPNTSMMYSYIIAILNSSFCSVSNSYLYNKDWHCVTTGANYLCFHNTVDNCKLYSDLQYAYLDHENAMNTIVRNTVAAGICVSALGVIDNCTIVSNRNIYKNCLVRLNASSNKNTAKYTVQNVYLEPDPAANGTYVGVWIAASPQTTGNTYYIEDCVFENVKCNVDILCSFRFSLTSGSNYVIDNIYIKDTNLNVNLGRLSAEASYVDISNYVLVLSDCNNKNNNLYVTIGSSTYSFNELHILNSKIRDFLGSYVNVILNNFAATSIITSLISGVLRGTGIHSEISAATIKGVSEVTISDMRKSAIITYFNISKSNDGKMYYQRYIGSESVVTELT